MSKERAQQLVEQVFNKKNLSAIDEFVATDIIDHSAPAGLPLGIEGYRMKVSAFVSAFPDLTITYEHQIVENDMIAGRFRLTGTQKGEFGGIPASNNKISVTGHDFVRFIDGKMVEHWVEMDTFTMMQQLGVVPT